MCEIAGQGPIPVADAWRMIDGDAFVAAVTTKGTEIDKVVHLGRKPTVLQKTALEWFSAGECSIEGCTAPARIEIDHVADWADTKITALPDLASPCGHHHDLKTHRGYTFGPPPEAAHPSEGKPPGWHPTPTATTATRPGAGPVGWRPVAASPDRLVDGQRRDRSPHLPRLRSGRSIGGGERRAEVRSAGGVDAGGQGRGLGLGERGSRDLDLVGLERSPAGSSGAEITTPSTTMASCPVGQVSSLA